jgi:hypothetical protein
MEWFLLIISVLGFIGSYNLAKFFKKNITHHVFKSFWIFFIICSSGFGFSIYRDVMLIIAANEITELAMGMILFIRGMFVLGIAQLNYHILWKKIDK